MPLCLGSTADSEIAGLRPVRMAIIETNGAIKQADSLKVTYDGAAATGVHLRYHPLDAALLLPTVAGRQLDVQPLAPHCRACRVRQVCGGGLYAHRYHLGTGFANPSVYCPDLRQLIGHVRAHKLTTMPGSPGPLRNRNFTGREDILAELWKRQDQLTETGHGAGPERSLAVSPAETRRCPQDRCRN
jgi:radical SAM protein with 4Fe4S-binding SPASM domain